jgi:hypothetical protein
MSSPLYQMYGQPQQPAPQSQQPQNIISEFMNFRNNFQGDPKARVMNMLTSGRVSQEEYNQAVQQANQLYSMMNGR